mmetsp:Transcript_15562/g.39431  ORF Transcript_15562/g.39431 Transcript_15562/m.39431 type:complete len:256 (+) Transcript_15562:253-1020(+)
MRPTIWVRGVICRGGLITRGVTLALPGCSAKACGPLECRTHWFNRSAGTLGRARQPGDAMRVTPAGPWSTRLSVGDRDRSRHTRAGRGYGSTDCQTSIRLGIDALPADVTSPDRLGPDGASGQVGKGVCVALTGLASITSGRGCCAPLASLIESASHSEVLMRSRMSHTSLPAEYGLSVESAAYVRSFCADLPRAASGEAIGVTSLRVTEEAFVCKSIGTLSTLRCGVGSLKPIPTSDLVRAAAKLLKAPAPALL